ncbi:uncharacterized protein LOC121503743 [Xyrichtys novacula]|uniref:Uncharacterized protein LOC121503743 n=1 Tax=Xyrichtys novacula TaxID=13765 RepID=A0AAV1GSA7_XYRNO|nr:uncharacterized protein LOC121503743 [Xyrichtys novacula]
MSFVVFPCRNMLKEIAGVDKSHRSLKERQILVDFAIKRCENEEVRTWLKENVHSKDFSKLVDMFCFLHEELNKQREKIDKEDIDIIFVAHGSIKDPLIPASCLLPLSTIQDVVLYSPWNCSLTADAAYGISTGYLKPEHRIFYCKGKKNPKIPHKDHQPTKLPNNWNSMKKAGKQKIPNISVSPLVPEDGAWDRIVRLQSQYGGSGRNRVLIPFILPEKREFSVPFFVVTLALSLVLYFSRYRATVHLAACLTRSVPTSKLPESDLNHQYSHAIDETVMKSSEEMLRKTETPLSKLHKTLLYVFVWMLWL